MAFNHPSSDLPSHAVAFSLTEGLLFAYIEMIASEVSGDSVCLSRFNNSPSACILASCISTPRISSPLTTAAKTFTVTTGASRCIWPASSWTSWAFVIDFVQLNRLAAGICAQLHDRILLPGKSGEVTLQEREGQIEVSSHGKRFSLPSENCRILPLPNTTAEMLAWYIMESLLPLLAQHSALEHLDNLEIAVEEADHQWGICRRSIDSGRT